MTVAPVPADRPADGPRPRLALGTVVTGAFVVTLLRPVSWALGLLGFLAGGGILLVGWPILVLPTPTGLQNLLAGPVSSLVFGGLSPALVQVIVAGIVGAATAILAGTAVGAWAERQGIAIALEAAADDGLGPAPTDLEGAPGAWRVTAIRLLALVPVLIAMVFAARPVYDAAYQELVLPRDLLTPLPVRVIGQVPVPLLGVALAWLLADAAAAVGVRRLVLERRSVFAAWWLGWLDLARRPHRVIPTALLGAGVLLALVGPSMAAAAIGWGRVRDVLEAGRDPVLVLGATVVWVAIWVGGLVLAGVAAAVRSAAWTLEIAGSTAPRPAAPVGPGRDEVAGSPPAGPGPASSLPG